MNAILKYRMHVILLAGMLALIPFPKVTQQSGLIALAMAMGMAWVYLFNKVTDTVEDEINIAAHPIEENLRSPLGKIAIACLVLPVLWLWQMPGVLAVYLVFAGLLGFLYSYPIGQKHFRLKNVLVLKNVSSAVIWSACACLPYYVLNPSFNPLFLARSIASVFVTVLCIEIIWDIRDIDGDIHAGVRTLPNTLGVFGSKLLTLLIFSLFCLWLYGTFPTSTLPFPLVIAHIATFLIICLASRTRPPWYFHLLVFVWIIYSAILIMWKL